MNTKEFSFARFLNVLKRDLFFQYKGAIITISAILGIYFLIDLISFAASGSADIVLFSNGLFIAGIIASSTAFQEFHSKSRGITALSYPASTAEKYASKWAITTLGYILSALIIYFVFSAFMKGVILLIFGQGIPLFNPLDFRILQVIAGYLWMHSIFFFGAVFFRRAAFIKTLLSVIVLAIVISIFVGLVTGAVFFGVIRDIIINSSWSSFNVNYGPFPGMAGFTRVLRMTGIILLGYCLPAALWIAGFVRFKEIEVK